MTAHHPEVDRTTTASRAAAVIAGHTALCVETAADLACPAPGTPSSLGRAVAPPPPVLPLPRAQSRSEAQEPPALPDEVWRCEDASCAVTVNPAFPLAPDTWQWLPESADRPAQWVKAGRVLHGCILSIAFLAERARAERAEQGRAAYLRGLAEQVEALQEELRAVEARATRLAAEGDAMRNTALLALAEETDPTAALRAILAVPRACRARGCVVEPARQCYAVPACYACLPPPPPLETIEVGS